MVKQDCNFVAHYKSNDKIVYWQFFLYLCIYHQLQLQDHLLLNYEVSEHITFRDMF
jgi:hypothetical protein